MVVLIKNFQDKRNQTGKKKTGTQYFNAAYREKRGEKFRLRHQVSLIKIFSLMKIYSHP